MFATLQISGYSACPENFIFCYCHDRIWVQQIQMGNELLLLQNTVSFALTQTFTVIPPLLSYGKEHLIN